MRINNKIMITTLLLSGNYTEQSALLTNLTTSEAFYLTLIIAVVGMIVQARLNSVFNKYSKVAISN